MDVSVDFSRSEDVGQMTPIAFLDCQPNCPIVISFPRGPQFEAIYLFHHLVPSQLIFDFIDHFAIIAAIQ